MCVRKEKGGLASKSDERKKNLSFWGKIVGLQMARTVSFGVFLLNMDFSMICKKLYNITTS